MLLQDRKDKKREFISRLNISKKSMINKSILKELPTYDEKANKNQETYLDIVDKYKLSEGESEYLSLKVKKSYF
jgi:hypothetical protein